MVKDQKPLAVVVEDEWLVRMELADSLADNGWEVVEFGTGEDAIAFLDQNRATDLLVTDIRLSGQTSGWDVAERFRRAFPGLAVIYCSGNVPDERRKVPDSLFLAKPCPMETLLEASRRTRAH
jgi:CheY-like chemotaxis protein